MRRIYVVLAVLLILAAFVGGYLIGKSGEINLKQELSQIHAERDQLTYKLRITEELADSAIASALVFKKKYQKVDTAIKVLVISKDRMAKDYEREIKRVKQYTAPQLDSFFVERYTFRPTFNNKLRPVTLPEWRASMIAEDLVRLDSMRLVNSFNQKIILEQQKTIYLRDTTIAGMEFAIAKKDTANSILLRREMTHARESFVWKRVATKYKRQRNLVIAGATVSIGGVIYFWLKR